MLGSAEICVRVRYFERGDLPTFKAYADEAGGAMDDLINDNVRLPRKLPSANHMD